MHEFALWAPHASQVELELSGEPRDRLAMTAAADGWWELRVARARHGTDYAFRLDGGEPLPDPRSRWQPYGVHGVSRVFDPQQHRWTDRRWRGAMGGAGIRGAVLYELHLGTFTSEGTLDAAADRLPELVDLGVDVVELMPVGAFPGRWGWGYDGVDPGAVHAAYGGPGALQRFVDIAHDLGLGVCLDVVENHLGPSGNYLARFGPYFTDRHATPWGDAVNLDGGSSAPVRRWILDRLAGWFRDFHADALRLDAVHEMHDDSQLPLLAQLSAETAELSQQLGRPLDLVAESDVNDPRTVQATDSGGLGMTAQWADDVHHAIHAAISGERQGYYVDFGSMATLAHAMTRVFVHEGGWSTFRERDWGKPVDPQVHRGHEFVAYLHNHDQVGNRARGERLSPRVDDGLLACGAALVLCGPFTPMLFMGEEWAARTPWLFFTDYDEPELADAVRAGRREEFARFGWEPGEIPDPQDGGTRARSVLRWNERDLPPGRRMLAWHRQLIGMRRRVPDLRSDDLAAADAAYDEDDRWLTLRRGEHLLAVNLGDRAVKLRVPDGLTRVVAQWDPARLSPGSLHLPARSAAVLAP